MKNCFVQLFRKEDEDAKKSVVKVIPFTCLYSFFFGIPLVSPFRFRHLILLSVTLSLRIWATYQYYVFNINVRPAIELSTVTAIYAIAYVLFYILVKRRIEIVKFISSDASLAPRMRKLDLIWLLFYSGMLIHAYFWYIHLVSKSETVESFLIPVFSPFVRSSMLFTFMVLNIMWFELSPLCVTLYFLGFNVLYSYKLNTLNSILNESMSARNILMEMKKVSIKHHQFETTFGPFAFFCFCYSFFATVYFFFNLKLVIQAGKSYYYYSICFCLLVVTLCFGMIYLVSCRNERLRLLTNLLLDQLEAKLIDGSPGNHFMIFYLRNKISTAINEPLTACRMVFLDRQIIFAFLGSCVSFSVLYIQINNGALTGGNI